MASNPMQRKARNSFLLGMLLTLVIAGVIIAFLMLQILNQKKAEREEKQALAKVYVLKQDVSSGQVITEDMLEKMDVNKDLIPSNATSNVEVFENFALQDKEGNNVYTKVDSEGKGGLFVTRNGKESQIKQEESTQNYYIDKCPNGSCVYIKRDDKNRMSLYVELNEIEYQLQDNNGNAVYMKYNKNNEISYYTIRNNSENILEENPNINFKSDDSENDIKLDQLEKQYLELNSVPLVAKVTMKKNTILTTEMISKSDSQVQNDVRKQEYNALVLPADLTSGDYIDIRLMLPSGQDYIVVSKKEVQIPVIDDVESTDTIWVNLSEDEILHMSCAIYDAYSINGSRLYAVKYTEAGMQEAAKITYPANQSTLKLLENDPNILDRAMTELASRYNDRVKALRNDYINEAINQNADQAEANIQTKMQESITKSQTSRKSYLDSLAGVVD